MADVRSQPSAAWRLSTKFPQPEDPVPTLDQIGEAVSRIRLGKFEDNQTLRTWAGEALDMLAAHPVAQPAGAGEPVAWRNMDTAPKDGTAIDLWIDGEYPHRVAGAIWSTLKPFHICGEMAGYCDSCPSDEKGWVDPYDFHGESFLNPIAWMPCPAAPDTHPAPAQDVPEEQQSFFMRLCGEALESEHGLHVTYCDTDAVLSVYPLKDDPEAPAQDVAVLLNLLRGYERWEANLILHGDWQDEMPKLTRPLYDEMMALQEQRNAVLLAATPTNKPAAEG